MIRSIERRRGESAEALDRHLTSFGRDPTGDPKKAVYESRNSLGNEQRGAALARLYRKYSA
jgi:hypothetical protein